MNFRAEAKSETSIGLSWSPPRQESVIKYELLFREGDHGREVGRTFDPATAFVVDDLKPNTEYAFRLAARSPQGLGAFTSVVRQRTLQSSRCLVDPTLICGGDPRPAQMSCACTDLGRACRSGWGVPPADPAWLLHLGHVHGHGARVWGPAESSSLSSWGTRRGRFVASPLVGEQSLTAPLHFFA
ncbi:receptor-type tyrosine-protein phosphatase S-like [Pteropus vampyrus]|uniref:Receptor-type tyrosine-protein phosphatase S-like n=1 Tax=Pteropus vampyrus TaxID=132908 RepID=A0A6P3S4I4_PTEVA|nr:receptor-type tyrosine-protein phosphatase S-like [Pteropus vampyrus]